MQSPVVAIWSDASGSWGCGALWCDQWCQVPWSEWPGLASASIAAKELWPILVATGHCDNKTVEASIKVETLRWPRC